MSHNSVRIGNSAPNVSGLINITLEDLSDIDLTGAAEGDAIIYNSGSGTWTPQAPTDAGVKYMYLGRGEANNYTNTARTMNVNDHIAFYDSNARAQIPGATINYIGATTWADSITLPAGTYSIISVINVAFSASGYISTAWRNKTTGDYLTCIGTTGALAANYNQNQTAMIGAFTLTAPTDIECLIVAGSGIAAASSQSTTISTRQSLFIRQL